MNESSSPPSLVPSGVQASLSARAASRELIWKKLIDRIRAGDQTALAELYDESSPLVFGLTFRILGNAADAEEVTLDVYKQIWRTAPDYDAGRGSVSAWVVTLARTRAIDRQRHAATRIRVEQPMENSVGFRAPHPGPEEQSVISQTERRVRHALGVLSEEQREAIELAFFSGLTHSELSNRLGAPLGTVKTRIRQGMLRLRKEFGGQELGALV